MASIASIIRDFIDTCLSEDAEENGKSLDEVAKKYLGFSEKLFEGRELFSTAVGLINPEARETFEKKFNEELEEYFTAKEKYKTEPKKLLDWFMAASLRESQ